MLVEHDSKILKERRTSLINYGNALDVARKCAEQAPEGEQRDRAMETEKIIYEGLVKETALVVLACNGSNQALVLRVGTIFAVPKNLNGAGGEAEAKFRSDVEESMKRRKKEYPDPIRVIERQKMKR